MKIVLIGPGIMPIPPTGWGAVEILVWDTKIALEKLGHEVLIINTKNGRQIIDEINNFKPDFVHVLMDGKVVKSGGPELALELEKKGYENIN